MKKHIPNTLTLLNLFCGVWATIFAYKGEFNYAAYAFLAGVLFDFLDGYAARLLKVKSEFGKQLDSLADLITSGLAPSMVIFHLMFLYNDVPNYYLCSPAFLIVCFSALRLAKFNLDTRQTDSFIGLPTPANGLIIMFLPFFMEIESLSFLYNYWVLLAITIICSLLLVSELKLFALKNLSFKKFNRVWLLIGIAIVLLIFLKLAAFPIIILVYILLSLIPQKKNKKAA